MGRPKPKLEEEKTEGDLSGCDGVGPVLTHANAPPNTPEERLSYPCMGLDWFPLLVMFSNRLLMRGSWALCSAVLKW